MRAERAGDDLDPILSGACTCGSIRTLWKNNSLHKSFVSGVLAGHDNRVSCLGVTEVKFFFTYWDALFSTCCIFRIVGIYSSIGWKNNCNWSLGLVSSNLVPLILILTEETNAKESVHGISKELFVKSKHEVPPCLTMQKLMLPLTQVVLFT